jgi:hypothetical protein
MVDKSRRQQLHEAELEGQGVDEIDMPDVVDCPAALQPVPALARCRSGQRTGHDGHEYNDEAEKGATQRRRQKFGAA